MYREIAVKITKSRRRKVGGKSFAHHFVAERFKENSTAVD